MPTDQDAWLNLTPEDALDPDLPICDPHHHLWDQPNNRYLLDELLQDTGSGHNIVQTVFVECLSMYRKDGPREMKPIGETEFVQGIAARMRILILCLLCTFGLVAGWTLEPQGAVPSGYHPNGSFCIWPDGIIPYVFDDSVPERERETILNGIRTWDTKTVLRFVERTPQHEDYVRFTLGVTGTGLRCERIGEHFVPVELGASYYSVLHNLGHLIGLEHEQQRRDRDRYLTVFRENIAATPLARDAWHPRPGFGRDIGVYDYRSIMHYHFIDPDKQRNHARLYLGETIPPGMPFGASDELSPGDVDSVARLYGHIPDEHVIATNPAGLDIIVDGERMTAPASFAWESGSEHTLEVPSPQFRDGARYLFGRWSDDGGRAHTITATDDTTLYQTSFIAQHQVSTKVQVWCRVANVACSPEDASITVSPPSPDGHYTLRTPIEVAATSRPGSQLRLMSWKSSTDYYAGWLRYYLHGPASNPVSTFVMSGMTYEAVFGNGPLFRVDSNVDPVQVVVGDWWGETPSVFVPERFAGTTTVAPKLRNPAGEAYRHRFRSWSDGGARTHEIEVPQDADTTLTLTLDTDYRLTTRAWQDWHGNRIETVPPSDDGFYPEGTEVRLLAVAKPPAKFIGWNGDVSGREPAASVVMDDGQLAEAVFAYDNTELQLDMPEAVSLRWNGNDLDFERYLVQVPADASELEVEFRTRVVAPGAEAGLFLTHESDPWPHHVHHENADRVLRAGEVATITVPRPPDGWPAAYFILIRAAESGGGGTHTLEGTLVARVSEEESRTGAEAGVGGPAAGFAF